MGDQERKIDEMGLSLVIAETMIEQHDKELDELKSLVKEIAENVIIIEKNISEEQASFRATVKVISVFFAATATIISCVATLKALAN